MKTLCMIPQWWVRVIVHPFRPTGSTPPRVSPKGKLWTLGDDDTSMEGHQLWQMHHSGGGVADGGCHACAAAGGICALLSVLL